MDAILIAINRITAPLKRLERQLGRTNQLLRVQQNALKQTIKMGATVSALDTNIQRLNNSFKTIPTVFSMVFRKMDNMMDAMRLFAVSFSFTSEISVSVNASVTVAGGRMTTRDNNSIDTHVMDQLLNEIKLLSSKFDNHTNSMKEILTQLTQKPELTWMDKIYAFISNFALAFGIFVGVMGLFGKTIPGLWGNFKNFRNRAGTPQPNDTRVPTSPNTPQQNTINPRLPMGSNSSAGTFPNPMNSWLGIPNTPNTLLRPLLPATPAKLPLPFRVPITENTFKPTPNQTHFTQRINPNTPNSGVTYNQLGKKVNPSFLQRMTPYLSKISPYARNLLRNFKGTGVGFSIDVDELTAENNRFFEEFKVKTQQRRVEEQNKKQVLFKEFGEDNVRTAYDSFKYPWSFSFENASYETLKKVITDQNKPMDAPQEVEDRVWAMGSGNFGKKYSNNQYGYGASSNIRLGNSAPIPSGMEIVKPMLDGINSLIRGNLNSIFNPLPMPTIMNPMIGQSTLTTTPMLSPQPQNITQMATNNITINATTKEHSPTEIAQIVTQAISRINLFPPTTGNTILGDAT